MKEESITRGNGNVFADLGLANAEDEALKADLALSILEAIRTQGLTQAQAAEMIGESQPNVSLIVGGKLRTFSAERLMKLLTALGKDVELRIMDAPAGQDRGRISVVLPGGSRRAASHIETGRNVDLIVLSAKDRAARCRVPGTNGVITLRASRLWDAVPGEVINVRTRKQWSYAGHPYISGDILSSRLDVGALGLVPLRLEPHGDWNPADEYWGEDDDPIEEWARPIIERGPRPEFEMEQVLPGASETNWDTDPIIESNDFKAAGDRVKARKILMDLLAADLRCLDAHAHLGNLVFDHSPREALRHYEAGVRIGELSLAPGFDGVLSWGLTDNRPFLRCLQGYGLCLWRLDRRDEAGQVFERMLWLNPSDNQGARFLLSAVRAGEPWDERVGT